MTKCLKNKIARNKHSYNYPYLRNGNGLVYYSNSKPQDTSMLLTYRTTPQGNNLKCAMEANSKSPYIQNYTVKFPLFLYILRWTLLHSNVERSLFELPVTEPDRQIFQQEIKSNNVTRILNRSLKNIIHVCNCIFGIASIIYKFYFGPAKTC